MIKVAAAVIVSDGKILAAKRKNERLGGGFWEFPGGKLEQVKHLNKLVKERLPKSWAINVKCWSESRFFGILRRRMVN